MSEGQLSLQAYRSSQRDLTSSWMLVRASMIV